jgi:hypothetical protein
VGQPCLPQEQGLLAKADLQYHLQGLVERRGGGEVLGVRAFGAPVFGAPVFGALVFDD